MQTKLNVPLFYLPALLLVVTTVMHMVMDPPDSKVDLIADLAFIGAILLLLGLAAFVFRPQLRRLSFSMARMDATLAQMNLLKTVASAANEAESPREGLQIAIDTICDYTGWAIGHVYLYSEDKNALVSSGVWYARDSLRYSKFIIASNELELAPQQGFVGEVYNDTTPMWILDVADSNVYTRKQVAVAAGLKAAFAFPIFIGRKAVAVMEFYSSESSIPDEELLSVMANIGKQLGQTIERAQFQERALLLETVIKSASDSITIAKVKPADADLEIIYVNEAFTGISGYTAEEVIGKAPEFLQGRLTKRETRQAMQKALLAGEPFKDELLNVSKDGKKYWLDISIVPVRNGAGVVTHFAALERDITAKKEEEIKEKQMWQQLKRANLKAEAAARDLQESLTKAEAANKAKGDFLANMSHELRTPMNGVLGMAHLLIDTPLDDEQKELVSTINGSAENLLMLLNDILDFSKIEAGALALEHIAFSFGDLLHRTGNLLRPQAEMKAVELAVSCDPHVPAYLWGDPGRMRQIITNLLGNAIKFTEQGHVRVKASVIEHDEADRLHVAVEDTGMGIAPDKLGEIFEKFTQADATVTRKYGGTGLGLAITKQLVMLMDGEIGVESAVGKGSTFWFTIPCRPARADDAHAHADNRLIACQAMENRKPIAQARVLLVDDYPVNRVFAEKLLRKFGFRHIDIAEDGMQAIMQYRSGVYDMIFMDCQMPELDGYQATGKIRMLEEGTSLHTPIVAMTANAMVGDREKCFKAGMDDYLSKPLRAEHLQKVLQAWFVLDAQRATLSVQRIEPSVLTAAAETPVDMEQLRLFTDGDPEEEKALAALFLDQAYAMIELLAQSTGDDGCDAWKSAAHRFKGSSANLGATTLHQLCKCAEIHFDDAPPAKQQMLAAIREETQRVQQFFAPA